MFRFEFFIFEIYLTNPIGLKEGGMSKSQGKDIWTLIKQNKDPSFLKPTQEEHEKTVIFLGNRQSGKSSIIHNFTQPNNPLTAPPEPTIALDYLYTKRESKLHHYSTHIWELAGGKSLLTLLKEVVQMTNIHNTIFVVVVDVSKPASVFHDLLVFLRHLEDLTKHVYELMRRHNKSELPKRLIGRQEKRFRYDTHPDKKSNTSVRFSGVSTVIVANKFDIFSRDEPKRVRMMSRSLRLLSHLHASSLVYSSKTHPKGVCDLLNHLVYGTRLDERKFISVKNELDIIHMIAGRDQLAKIKKMDVTKQYKSVHEKQNLIGPQEKRLLAWYTDFTNLYGKVQSSNENENNSKIDLELEKYEEPAIDQMRKRKNEQFIRFKKELEREKRGRMKKSGNNKSMV